MTDAEKTPEDCKTMSDVRAGVDETDRRLVGLLETRFGYMRAAARIKQGRDSVRDETRKSLVIRNAAQAAGNIGLPQDAIADIWELLVEISIAYEYNEWDRLNG